MRKESKLEMGGYPTDSEIQCITSRVILEANKNMGFDFIFENV